MKNTFVYTVFDLISRLFAYIILGQKNALFTEPPYLPNPPALFFYCKRALCIVMATTNKHIHKYLINEMVV